MSSTGPPGSPTTAAPSLTRTVWRRGGRIVSGMTGPVTTLSLMLSVELQRDNFRIRLVALDVIWVG